MYFLTVFSFLVSVFWKEITHFIYCGDVLELEPHRVVIAVGGEAYAGSVSTYRAAIDALPGTPPTP